jgi:hypothetical protein
LQQKKETDEYTYARLLEEKKWEETKTDVSLLAFENLAEQFRSLGEYKDAAKLATECTKLVQEETERLSAIAKENEYALLLEAKKQLETNAGFNIEEFKSLAIQFRGMGGYKNTGTLCEECFNEASCRQSEQWASQGRCRYCGGEMGRRFTKKCKSPFCVSKGSNQII